MIGLGSYFIQKTTTSNYIAFHLEVILHLIWVLYLLFLANQQSTFLYRELIGIMIIAEKTKHSKFCE